MRIKMEFTLKKPQLDIEYRRSFLSLLKNCFQMASEEIYEKFYENGTSMKPFTFAVYLPRPEFRGEVINLQSTAIQLNFSTFLMELGVYFYNALLKKKMQFVPYSLPGGNEMRLQRIGLVREKVIQGNEVVFKTLSPFLVRRHEQESNKDEYMTKKHELFIAQIQESMRVQVEELLGTRGAVEFSPVLLREGFPIKHYGTNVQGNTGIFKLTGNPEILDFIYKTGIGSRRSEGFGMLDIV